MSSPLCCFGKQTSFDVDESEQVPRESYNRTGHTKNECFFVITAIFNPVSYQKRYDLYHRFAQHMQESGAQLITIECIFPSLGQHQFQVTRSDHPLHIQLKSESVYWIKENLINIAVSRLPPHAKWVCWLDADIYFHSKNWVDQTISALQKYTVVQMFKTAEFLGPQNQVLRTDYSFGYSVVHDKPIDQSRYAEWYPHPGYGWAMSKSAFCDMNGLPEYDIVGSGDLHFAFSLLDRVSNAIERELNPEYKQMIMEQSRAVYLKLTYVSKAESKAMVGYIPVTISHNWHGSRKNRQYVDRWKILIAHNFNFRTDVRRNADGLLVFVNPTSGLQEDIQIHFQKRNEDDDECKLEDNLTLDCKPKKPVHKYKAPKVPLPKKHVRRQSSSSSSSDDDRARNAYLYATAAGAVCPDYTIPCYDDPGCDDGPICPTPHLPHHHLHHHHHSHHSHDHPDPDPCHDYTNPNKEQQCGERGNQSIHNTEIGVATASYANDYHGMIETTSHY